MEQININIKEKGKIDIVVSDKHEDGASALQSAINSLTKAKVTHENQIESMKSNIQSNKDAIKYTQGNIEYINMKTKVFETALRKLKLLGYKPKLLKNDVENKNK